MEFLPENKTFPEMKKGDDPVRYINSFVNFVLKDIYREPTRRTNFLLERVNVTNEKSEDGKRYMKVEFVLPGQTRNDDNNWRLLLKSKDEDSDGIDETFDVELQMRRSGAWVASDIWHG